MIKLLLAGNFERDLDKFNLLKFSASDILDDSIEVYWVDETQDESKNESQIIDSVSHKILDFSAAEIENEKFVCFTDHLNVSIVTILESLPNTTCYYYNLKENQYKIVEAVDALVDVYDTSSAFVDFLYDKDKKILDVTAEGRDFINDLYKPYYDSISKKHKRYPIFYKEKFFFNKFILFFEAETHSIITKINVKSFIEGDLKTLIGKSKTILVTNLNALEKSDQEYVIHSVENFNNVECVLFDCGNSFENEFLKSNFSEYINLPDSDSVKKKYYPTGIFLFLLKELGSEINFEIKVVAYKRIFGDDFLRKIIFDRYSIPEIFHSLKAVIPKGKYTIDITDLNFWYSVIKELRINEESQLLQVDSNTDSLPKEDIKQEQIKISKQQNDNDITSTAYDSSVKKIIKNDKVIEIIYKGQKLPITKPDLDGLFYIYYILRRDYGAEGISSDELYLKLYPAAFTKIEFEKGEGAQSNSGKSVKELREEMKSLISQKIKIEKEIKINEEILDNRPDMPVSERNVIYDLIQKGNSEIDKIKAKKETVRNAISEKIPKLGRAKKRIKERIDTALEYLSSINDDCAKELRRSIKPHEKYFFYNKPEKDYWTTD